MKVTYELDVQSELQRVDSSNPRSSRKDSNILGIRDVDSTWLVQCFPNRRDFHPHMKPKSCSTETKQECYTLRILYESWTYSELIGDGSVVDELLQISRHVLGQMVGVIVVMRRPSEDLVQLEENAGSAAVIVVVVLLNARCPGFDVNIADLTSWRFLSVVAVVNVLTTSRNRTRCLVSCKWLFIVNKGGLFNDYTSDENKLLCALKCHLLKQYSCRKANFTFAWLTSTFWRLMGQYFMHQKVHSLKSSFLEWTASEGKT